MTISRPIAQTRPRQRGFTLIELTIAITLVAAIATGMLLAMRNGLLTMERTTARLDDNRRALAVDEFLRGQLGAVIPAQGRCLGQLQPLFRGTATRMLLISSHSVQGGSRGLPVVAEYAIVPNTDGTFRLMVNETLFAGAASTEPACLGAAADVGGPPSAFSNEAGLRTRTQNWFLVADRLAAARFLYQERDPRSQFGGGWKTFWDQPFLPWGVRIEMLPVAPETQRIPIGSVTVPLHITRQPTEQYIDVL